MATRCIPLTRSQVPDVELSFFNAEGQMEKISTKSLCSGKKVGAAPKELAASLRAQPTLTRAPHRPRW